MFCLVSFLFMSSPALTQDDPDPEVMDPQQLDILKENLDFEDDKELFEDELITKEIDGVVDKVGEDYIVIRDQDDTQVKLLVDAETVMYIDEEKSELADIREGYKAFAFYVDESGLLKCDLLDVTPN